MTAKKTMRMNPRKIKRSEAQIDLRADAAIARPDAASENTAAALTEALTPPEASQEIGGRDGPDPTRFGDWEKNGRCIDF